MYVLPSLKVRQVFEPVLDAGGQPLAALVVGPGYGLHRIETSGESTLVGAYDRAAGHVDVAYPGKTAGSLVDLVWGGVFAVDAFLEYADITATLLADNGNRVRSTSLVFRTANGYNRSVEFGTRDVVVGDRFESEGVDGTIVGFAADVDAAVFGTLAASSGNAGATTVGATVDDDDFDDPSLSVTGSAALYDGIPDGHPSETYVMVVTKAGVPGTAEVAVYSASGTDDVADVTVVDGAATAMGSRGATFTVADAGSDSELAIGDTWTITVSQDYTPAQPVRGGTYTGPVDTTYLVRVVEGGEVGTDTVRFDVYTTNGLDSHPVAIVVADTATPVGSRGLIVTFTTGDQFNAGDVFSIDATASAQGAVKTLILSAILDGVTAGAVDIQLGLPVAKVAVDSDDYSRTSGGLTVSPGAMASGAWLTASDNLEIMDGDIHVEYRELLVAQANAMRAARTLSEAAELAGVDTIDNPLGQHVAAAIRTAAGEPVYFVGTASDNIQGYTDALAATENSDAPYSVVLCSTAHNNLAKSHALDMSTPEIGQWRVAWLAAEPTREFEIEVSTINASVANRTLTSAGALFQTNGVAVGDIVRIGYGFDANGNPTYKTATVDAVVSEDSLTLASAPDVPQSVAIKFEVWRNLSNAQYSEAVSAVAQEMNHRRVRVLWGRNPRNWEGPVPMTVLAAAAAGLRSSSAPHQPLTNVEVDGVWVDEPGVSRFLLDLMAGSGVWIVTRDDSGSIYTRHQVTTDPSDINHFEDSVTTNLDHMSRDYRDALSPFYGKGNVSDEMVALIGAHLDRTTSVITSRIYPAYLGPQLQGIDEQVIERDLGVRDRVNVRIVPLMPYPLNNLDLTIVVR